MMTIRTTLPPRGRDYRLDLFRGFANWAIYLDHIPNNVVNWVTQRNYGFSDAADLFVFISGYTPSFVRCAWHSGYSRSHRRPAVSRALPY